MMKHLFWIPWIMAALVLGILVCAALIIHMLFFQNDMQALPIGAQLVKEACHYALA